MPLSKPGFSSMSTVNFQMFKLILEKAEEPEIKLPPSAGSSKSKKFQESTYFCSTDYAKGFDFLDHNKIWKILKEMGILDHLNGLLRNLYADQEATVRTVHGTTDWFQIGKEVCQGYILSPCLFNFYAECQARWASHKLKISTTSDMGFPGGSEVKASASNAGDPGLIPGSGRSPGEGNGNPLQYFCLENPMDREAWWATVYRVAKSHTWLKRLGTA